jgi:hypothetical protein
LDILLAHFLPNNVGVDDIDAPTLPKSASKGQFIPRLRDIYMPNTITNDLFGLYGKAESEPNGGWWSWEKSANQLLYCVLG